MGRKRSKYVKFSRHPKKTLVTTSSIPDAGLGLFLCESVKEGDRVAVYTGTELNLIERVLSSSEYVLKISNNVYLDSKDSRHCTGRYINCSRRSGLVPNVRFAAGTTYNYDPTTKLKWISIFADRDIKASSSNPVELLIDYGEEYWRFSDNEEHININFRVVVIDSTIYKL